MTQPPTELASEAPLLSLFLHELRVVRCLEVAVLRVVAPAVSIDEASKLLAQRRSGRKPIRPLGLRGLWRHALSVTETPREAPASARLWSAPTAA